MVLYFLDQILSEQINNNQCFPAFSSSIKFWRCFCYFTFVMNFEYNFEPHCSLLFLSFYFVSVGCFWCCFFHIKGKLWLYVSLVSTSPQTWLFRCFFVLIASISFAAIPIVLSLHLLLLCICSICVPAFVFVWCYELICFLFLCLAWFFSFRFVFDVKLGFIFSFSSYLSVCVFVCNKQKSI